MIQNIQFSGRRIRLVASDRLRVHYLSLARRVAGLQRPGGDDGGTATGVATVEPRSGASTVALNLAAALTAVMPGNVLLIDASFRQSGSRQRVPRSGIGLGEVLLGKQTPASCILETSIERLYLLPCGRVEPREIPGLPFENARNLHAELGDRFSWFVYDLPVATDVTHCFPLVQQLDAALLVVDGNKINEEKIHRAARRLEEGGTPLIGLVLNKV